jgi:hypothetical protein
MTHAQRACENACLQQASFGSRANWDRRPRLLVTAGGFRRDGTFVSFPAHDTARLTEAFRRVTLRLCVPLVVFDAAQAAEKITCPHCGVHGHAAARVPDDDRASDVSHARYGARNPVALERLTDDRAWKDMTYRSDKAEGAHNGHRDRDPLLFLAGVRVHIPATGPRDDAGRRLVCEPRPRHAGEGGISHRRRAARPRLRATKAGSNEPSPPSENAVRYRTSLH